MPDSDNGNAVAALYRHKTHRSRQVGNEIIEMLTTAESILVQTELNDQAHTAMSDALCEHDPETSHAMGR